MNSRKKRRIFNQCRISTHHRQPLPVLFHVSQQHSFRGIYKIHEGIESQLDKNISHRLIDLNYSWKLDNKMSMGTHFTEGLGLIMQRRWKLTVSQILITVLALWQYSDFC